MSSRFARSIVWLRRDVRLCDHVALARAIDASERVVCAFVLDPPLLRSERIGAPIVQCFFDAIAALREDLRACGSDLALLEGDALDELGRFAARIGATALFFNEDYEPDAIARDHRVTAGLRRAGIEVRSSLDHVYFGADEVQAESGKPYVVFSPYKRRWLARREHEIRVPYERPRDAQFLARADVGPTRDVPRPEEFGHASSDRYPRVSEVEADAALTTFLHTGIARYDQRRNFVAVEGTSQLSPALRAGTIGIRTCVERAFAAAGNGKRTGVDTWIGELIWRDFYQGILRTFPQVAHQPFIPAAAAIAWENDPALWTAWTQGRTGYPIVDAAMRALNATGWMHNRLRMIVASFLTKHLLIDYRWGERYFEQRLADADLGANNGGWQWSASTGTDAAPYFRVFNPIVQGQKFDADGAFVQGWLPELARVPTEYIHEPWTIPPLVAAGIDFAIGRDYPAPVVDHALARTRAIATFSAALRKPA